MEKSMFGPSSQLSRIPVKRKIRTIRMMLCRLIQNLVNVNTKWKEIGSVPFASQKLISMLICLCRKVKRPGANKQKTTHQSKLLTCASSIYVTARDVTVICYGTRLISFSIPCPLPHLPLASFTLRLRYKPTLYFSSTKMTRDEEETGQHRRKWSNGPHTTQQPLFSKLRSFNHLALSSVGSFFSGISTSKASYEGDDSIEHGSSVGCTAGHELDLDHDFNMAPQPTVSGSTDQPLEDSENDLTPHVSDCYILQREDYWNHQSPGDTVESLNEIHYGTRKSPRKAHISTFLPETRRFFGGLSRTRCVFDQNGCYDSDFASNSSVEPAMGSAPLSSTAVFPSSMASLDGSLFSTPSESRFVSHAHGHSGDLETPPLTPDLANNHVLPSIVPVGAFLKPSLTSGSSRFSSRFTLSDTSEEIPDNTEDGAIYTSPYLREIKEGKKPERVSVSLRACITFFLSGIILTVLGCGRGYRMRS